ncbi:MAG: DUF2516 family protein [Actinomycetales bacterium]|jgi:4-amino-4-deoxy-L-arabinose transferase-like glycosyltransferase|uniref:DUF2516 family protein n=1 Tax=Candidatus Phosphoribacter hodrii TaxID=2953743 RepID=A0A935IHE7_9MICO|nr:DUF2516 family protein [Candidatus Phosphoribacter hodrii]
MFSSISSVQGVVVLVLGLAALGAEVFALLDALRHRPDAFVAAGKRTKNFWLLVLGVATAVGFVSNVLSMFGVIAFVAAAVYLADVRPALKQVSGRGGGRQGPYGPW